MWHSPGVRRALLALLVGVALPLIVPSSDAMGGDRRSKTGKVTKSKKTPTKKSPRKEAKARKPSHGKRLATTSGRGRERERASSRVSRSTRQGPLTLLSREVRCPEDMVAVAGRFCVDRYEMTLVDAETERAWSPFYPPELSRAEVTHGFYEALLARKGAHDTLALPPLPGFRISPMALTVPRVIPQGYLSADEADRACRAAEKRLCTEAEWVTACRGEDARDFPYGQNYVEGACNVYRESHPTFLLHNNAARFHDDPRANLVAVDGRSLLRRTGETPACQSRWGEDAVFDMVGNLDEWVASEEGVFLGGFYSRGTRAGCFSRVSNHPRAYSDYSTGARCCADPASD